MQRAALLLLGLLFLAGCASHPGPVPTPTIPSGSSTAASDAPWPAIALHTVATGFGKPLFVTQEAGNDSLFVVEQGGRVRTIEDGKPSAVALVDLTGQVTTGSEQGLLGLAFDPDGKGGFVLDYTDLHGDTQVERWSTVCAAGACHGVKQSTLLTQAQPYPNHNGGMVLFGPDGKLYVGLGDGGSAGDPQDRAQNLGTLLGKIVRLNPDGSTPQDNPYVGRGAPDGRIWDYGVRNPWRFSFDRATGDLWIGDVGQNQWEEVDLEPAGGHGGHDYGWSRYEGTHLYDISRAAPDPIAPVAEYAHEQGRCSITGGYVARGSGVPGLDGVYLYADYCSGDLWGLRYAGGAWQSRLLLKTGANVSSFGEGLDGTLYVVDLNGAVLKVVAG